jgi:hypothetical protein
MRFLRQHQSETLGSDTFAQQARHPTHPRAFKRLRSLPLPTLVATLLCKRDILQQSLLDKVFASLGDDSKPVRSVSDRAIAKVRSHLHAPALNGLNEDLFVRGEAAGLLHRWHGFRLVVAAASVLMPAIRRGPRPKGLDAAEERLFAVSLTCTEMTPHADVVAANESERVMLANAFEKLDPSDVL